MGKDRDAERVMELLAKDEPIDDKTAIECFQYLFDFSVDVCERDLRAEADELFEQVVELAGIGARAKEADLKGLEKDEITPDHDWKVLTIDRCSMRCLQDIMYAVLNTGAEIKQPYVYGKREMLVMPSWTSAAMLIKVPRRMQVKSGEHATNLAFFEKIKGVSLSEPQQVKVN